jgi:hypothetical protein
MLAEDARDIITILNWKPLSLGKTVMQHNLVATPNVEIASYHPTHDAHSSGCLPIFQAHELHHQNVYR